MMPDFCSGGEHVNSESSGLFFTLSPQACMSGIWSLFNTGQCWSVLFNAWSMLMSGIGAGYFLKRCPEWFGLNFFK